MDHELYAQLASVWSGKKKITDFESSFHSHLMWKKIRTPTEFASSFLPKHVRAEKAWLVPHGLILDTANGPPFSKVIRHAAATAAAASNFSVSRYQDSEIIYRASPGNYEYYSYTVLYSRAASEGKVSYGYVDADVLFIREHRSRMHDAARVYRLHLENIFNSQETSFPSLCTSAAVLREVTRGQKREKFYSALLCARLNQMHSYVFGQRLINYVSDVLPFVSHAEIAHGSVMDLSHRYGHVLKHLLEPGLLFALNGEDVRNNAAAVVDFACGVYSTLPLNISSVPWTTDQWQQFENTNAVVTYGTSSNLVPTVHALKQEERYSPRFVKWEKASSCLVKGYLTDPLLRRDLRAFLSPGSLAMVDYMFTLKNDDIDPEELADGLLLPDGESDEQLEAYKGKIDSLNSAFLRHLHAMVLVFLTNPPTPIQEGEGSPVPPILPAPASRPIALEGLLYDSATVEPPENQASFGDRKGKLQKIMEASSTDPVISLVVNSNVTGLPYSLPKPQTTKTFVKWSGDAKQEVRGGPDHLFRLDHLDSAFLFLCSILWRDVRVVQTYADLYSESEPTYRNPPALIEAAAMDNQAVLAKLRSGEIALKPNHSFFETPASAAVLFASSDTFNHLRSVLCDAGFLDPLPRDADVVIDLATNSRLWGFCETLSGFVNSAGTNFVESAFGWVFSAAQNLLTSIPVDPDGSTEYKKHLLYRVASSALKRNNYRTRTHALQTEDLAIFAQTLSTILDSGKSNAFLHDARQVNLYPYVFQDTAPEGFHTGYVSITRDARDLTAFVDTRYVSEARLLSHGWTITSSHGGVRVATKEGGAAPAQLLPVITSGVMAMSSRRISIKRPLEDAATTHNNAKLSSTSRDLLVRFLRESGVLEASSTELLLSVVHYLAQAAERDTYIIYPGESPVLWSLPCEKYEIEDPATPAASDLERWRTVVKTILETNETLAECVSDVVRNMSKFSAVTSTKHDPVDRELVFPLVVACLYLSYSRASSSDKETTRQIAISTGLRCGDVAPFMGFESANMEMFGQAQLNLAMQGVHLCRG